MEPQNKKPIISDIADAGLNYKRYTDRNFNTDGRPLNPYTSGSDNLTWNPYVGNPAYSPDLNVSDIYTGERYDSTLVGQDHEQNQAAQQSALAQATNGLLKGVNLTATTVGGGLGTVYGIGKAIAPGGKFSDIWDNEFMQTIDEWNTNVDQNYLPNYYTNTETDSEWWSTDNWFTTNFLFDKLIKNSGFAVGAMISGNIMNTGAMAVGSRIGQGLSNLEKAARAKQGFEKMAPHIKSLSRAFSQGKNIEAAQALEKNIVSLADFTNKTKALEELAITTNRFASVSNGTRRTLVAAYSSAGEANFEAVQTSNETRDKLIEEYVKANGVAPTGADLEKINNQANRVGKTSFMGNMALLGVTEWFQLPYLIGSSYRATKAASNRFVRETGEIVYDGTSKAMAKAPKSVFGRAFKKGKRFSTYIFDPKEAGQEAGQFALQVGAQNYYDKASKSGDADWYVDGVLYGLYGTNEQGEGVGAFNSKEGIEGAIIGGITGGLMQGRQRYAEYKSKASNTQKFLDELEKAPTFKEAFKQRLRDANRGVVLQEEREEAIKEGNKLEVKDLEHDLMFNYLYNKVKYGRKDFVAQDIQELMNIATSGELGSLVEQGLASKEDTKESYLRRLEEVMTMANTIERLAGNVQEIYGGVMRVNAQGETVPAFSEAVLEQLTYVGSKIDNYRMRIPQLEADLVDAGIDFTAINEALDNPTKLEEIEYEGWTQIQNSQEINPTEKEKLMQSLDDVIEMKQREKFYSQQYNDIVTNPLKYSETKKDLKDPVATTDDEGNEVPADTVIVKTKKYPQGVKVQIGKEYMLGNVYEQTEKGSLVYRFPKLTFIGENEDGSLKIKDYKGVIRDVSREEFLDYNISTMDAVKKNPDASFVVRNANKVVYWNTGKDKSGKIPGRISWNTEKKQMVFTYKGYKGKPQEKAISADLFKPKKGYKEGLFSFGEELLSQADLNDIKRSEESGWAAEKAQQRRQARNEILTNLYIELNEQQESTEKLIENKKKDLATIKEKLNALKKDINKKDSVDKRAKKTVRFKKAANEAMAHSLKLSRMVRDLEQEIAELEDQQDVIQESISYVETLSQSLDNMPDDTREFLDDLKLDQMMLQEAAANNNKQVNAIQDMLKNAKRALKGVNDLIARMLTDFQNRFPDVPTLDAGSFMAYVNEGRGSLLLESIEEPFSYEEAKKSLEELRENITYLEEEEIPIAEKRINDILKHLEEMEADAKKIEDLSRGMDPVIERFQSIYDNYVKQTEEREAYILNTALHEQVIGTMSTSTPSKNGQDNYTRVPKKTDIGVVASTIVSSEFTDEGSERANRFAARFNDLEDNEDIKAVVITAKNEASGDFAPGLVDHILKEATDQGRTFDKGKAIFAVFVQENGDGSFSAIDEFGNVIEDGDFDKMVYQPFPLEELMANYPNPDGGITRQSMFRETTEETNALKEEYKKWRNARLASDTIEDPRSMSPSQGVFVYSQKFVDDKQVNDYDAKNSVVEAGLVSQEDLESEQVLGVATTNENITNNGVTFTTPLGRVFLNTSFGLVPMKANKFSDKKAATLHKVLTQIAINLSSKGRKDKIDSDTLDMFKWLRHTVQWGVPETKIVDGEVIDSKPGYSSVWFTNEANEEPKLFISGLGFSIPFTESYLKDNKEAITNAFKNLYHNVLSSSTNNDNYSNRFDEIVDIDADGMPVMQSWENYQSYLLSSERPAKDQIPLTTPIAPIVEEGDLNRKGIYFTFNDATEMFETPEPAQPSSTQNPSPTEPGETVTDTTDMSPVLDGKTFNTWVSNKGGYTVKYTATEEGVDKIQIIGADKIINNINSTVVPEERGKAIENFENGNKKFINENVIQPFVDSQNAALPKEDDQSEIDEALKELRGGRAGNVDEELYRLQTEEAIDTPENWDEISTFMKRALPQIPFYRVQNILRATKNRKALGMFHQGAVYVWEQAEIGTAYHEVFEAVWKTFASPEEKQKVVAEFKARQGTFVDRESGNTIAFSEATAQQMKEQLAEEFRDYKLDQTKPKGSLLARLFKELVDFIKSIFSKPNEIQQLYKKIDDGGFAAYNPHEVALSYANQGFLDIQDAVGDLTSEFRIDNTRINIPARELKDIIDHMTYKTISTLFKEDTSLLVNSNFRKAELYDTLYDELRNLFANQIADLEELKRNGKVDRAKLQRRINSKAQLWIDIKNEWEKIIDRHIDNLQTYDIIFDENDFALLNDEDNSGRGDYIDARKIDPFKKSSSAVKLMLATIPEINEADNKPKRSSIGGFVMMDIGEAFIQLMETLHTSVNLDDMMMRLNALSQDYPNYKLLYKRLLKENVETLNRGEIPKAPTYKKIQTNNFELISNFWKVFKKQRPDIITVFHLQGGETVVTDTSLTSSAKQAQYEMRNSIIDSIKNGRTLLFANIGGRYTAVKANNKGFNKHNLNPKDNKTYSNFLAELGINISPAQIKEFSNDQQKVFYSSVDGIKLSLSKISNIATINKNTLDIEGQLFKLGVLKAVAENTEFQSTYFNVNGERSQTFIGPNAVSNLYHTLSSINNKAELADTEFAYLLNDQNSANSFILSRIFTSTGKKKKAYDGVLKPVFVDGTINEALGRKKDSSKLSYVQRISQEMNANLEGIFMNLVPGDASIEWAVRMFSPNDPFMSDNDYKSGKYLDTFRGYLASELDIAKDGNRRIAVTRDNPTGANKRKLRFFDTIIKDETLKRNLLKSNTNGDKLVNNKTYKAKIDKAIKAYVESQIKETDELLAQYQLKLKGTDGISLLGINMNEGNIMSEELYKTKLGALTLNYMMANIELHKLIYSDPLQYTDELKRIKNFNSPRQALMYGSPALNSTLNKLYNYDGVPTTDFQREYFNAVTLEDVNVVNELEGYGTPVEETDGGGLITDHAYRVMMIRSGEWNDKLEAQYKYDMAYRDFFAGLPLSDAQLEYFDPENPDALNPNVPEFYTPVKPIVSGGKKNDRNYNDSVLDKFALFPMSYRQLHKLNPNSNMLALYEKMVKENVDYAVFKTGRKVGAEAVFKPYVDGKINTAPFQTTEQMSDANLPQTVLQIPFNIISIQTEVPTKTNNETTQGSQITKLATLDMMDAGVPIDFKLMDGDVEITNQTERYNTWLNMDEAAREAASPLWIEIKNNQALLEAKTNLGYKILLNKLGIKETADGFEVVKRERMAKTLKEEIFSRDVNDNIAESFQGFINGETMLEATPSYQQIRNILFSIARKNVIRPKINGGFKVQMFSTFFEENRIEAGKDSQGNTYFASKDLDFYQDEDGKRVAEIMVSRWFKSSKSDKELIEWFNTTEDGKKALESLGYRIPTQKQNSIDAFRVKKFLPEGMREVVVVPAELVKKAGSDFDIDKLSVYLKNITNGKNPRMIEFLTEDNSTLEDRYYTYIKEVADQDTQGYVRFLTSPQVDAINDKYKSMKQSAFNQFKDLKTSVKSQAKGFIQDLKDSRKELLTKQDDIIEKQFDAGRQLFRKLSAESHFHYSTLRDEIAKAGDQGPTEIIQYLALTEKLMASPGTSSNDKLVMAGMSINYKETLEILGHTEGEMKNINTLIESVIADKDANMTNIILNIRSKAKLFDLQREEEIDAVNVEWAKEVARIEDLPTLEEFSKMDIYSQQGLKGLDNAYIDSLFKLTSHPLNFDRLILPNSAQQAKDLAADIHERLGNDKIDYTNPGNILSRKFMSKLRQDFVSGKYAIGISAVAQTNNAQNQRSLVVVDPDRMDMIDPIDKFYMNEDPTLRFMTKNEIDGKVTLSMAKNGVGEYISDTVGQFIDGYVDISKGPWIMELGATSNVAGTWLFLIKAGVPFQDVAYFMNQPIIRDYIGELQRKGYSTLFSMPTIESIRNEYATKSKKKYNVIPTAEILKKNVGKKSLTEDQKAYQQFMFTEFLKYAKMSEHLLKYIQGSNFDTATFNDPFLVTKKQIQLEEAQNNSIISNVDDNLKASFVGNLFDNILNFRDAFAEVLVSDQPGGNGVKGPREVIEAVLRPYVTPYVNDKDFVKLARRVVENLFDYTMQTRTFKNSLIFNTFYDSGLVKSSVDQIIEARNEMRNHPIMKDNLIVKNLELVPSGRELHVDNITIKNKDNKVFNQNLTIAAFRELKAYMNKKYPGLYKRLIDTAVIQSGLTNSPISFTSLLPYEDFVSVYDTALNLIAQDPRLDDFLKTNEFQRSNASDENIVPVLRVEPRWSEWKRKYWNFAEEYVKDNLKKAMSEGVLPKMINVSTFSNVGTNDIVKFVYEEVPLTDVDIARLGGDRQKATWLKKKEMRAKGDFSYRKTGLFQKVYTFNSETGRKQPLIQRDEWKGTVYEKYVYKLINARGDSFRVQEYWKPILDAESNELLGTTSQVVSDFVNTREVSDKKVVEIFENGLPAKAEDSKLDVELVNNGTEFRVGNRTYPISFANAEKLISLGYTEDQAGSIIELVC